MNSKKLPFVRNIIVNLFCNSLSALILFGVISLATQLLSPAELGLFLLSRQIASVIANFSQLGTSQTLLRYLPLQENPIDKLIYKLISIIILICTSLILIFVFKINTPNISNLLLGSTNYNSLTYWTILYSIGLMFNFMAYTILFTKGYIFWGNLVNSINSGGILLVISFFLPAIYPTITAEFLLKILVYSTGILSLAIIIVDSVISLLKNPTSLRILLNKIKPGVHAHVNYGLLRSLTPFLDNMLFLIAPWVIRNEPSCVANITIALTLGRIIQVAILPMSQIFTLHCAQMLSDKNFEQIRKLILYSLASAILISLALFLFLKLYLYQLLYLWLKNQDIVNQSFEYANSLLYALMPLAVFYSLKGIIDALYVLPKNLITLSLGIAAFFLSYTVFPREPITTPLIVMFYSLLLTSLFWLRKQLIFIRKSSYCPESDFN